jgi:hypothetical protein
MPYTCLAFTNTGTIPVTISNVAATGFDEKQAVVSNGSDYTIGHADLASGEVVNFEVALHDTETVKLVKVTPYVAGSTGGCNEQS